MQHKFKQHIHNFYKVIVYILPNDNWLLKHKLTFVSFMRDMRSSYVWLLSLSLHGFFHHFSLKKDKINS